MLNVATKNAGTAPQDESLHQAQNFSRTEDRVVFDHLADRFIWDMLRAPRGLDLEWLSGQPILYPELKCYCTLDFPSGSFLPQFLREVIKKAGEMGLNQDVDGKWGLTTPDAFRSFWETHPIQECTSKNSIIRLLARPIGKEDQLSESELLKLVPDHVGHWIIAPTEEMKRCEGKTDRAVARLLWTGFLNFWSAPSVETLQKAVQLYQRGGDWSYPVAELEIVRRGDLLIRMCAWACVFAKLNLLDEHSLGMILKSHAGTAQTDGMAPPSDWPARVSEVMKGLL